MENYIIIIGQWSANNKWTCLSTALNIPEFMKFFMCPDIFGVLVDVVLASINQ